MYHGTRLVAYGYQYINKEAQNALNKALLKYKANTLSMEEIDKLLSFLELDMEMQKNATEKSNKLLSK